MCTSVIQSYWLLNSDSKHIVQWLWDTGCPPISPSYLFEQHTHSYKHLYYTLDSKLPKTTLGLCILAVPGFSQGGSNKHLVEERPFCWITWNSLALNLSIIHHNQWNLVKVKLTICPIYMFRSIYLARNDL